MYSSIEISQRIKRIAKIRCVTLHDLLKSCGLSINTLANMNSGRMPQSDSLGKIADFLDCSVDFLLGRTNVEHLDENISADKLSKDEFELLKNYHRLSENGKDKVVDYTSLVYFSEHPNK